MSGTTSFYCSFGSPDSDCGIFGESPQILTLNSCQTDMTSYLSSLGVSAKRSAEGQGVISEQELILNRGGCTDGDIASMTICPKHRHKLTTGWPGRQRITCSHPLHKGVRKKIKQIRRVNAQMSSDILHIHKIVLPIGSAICTTCRKEHYKAVNSASISKSSSIASEAIQEVGDASTSGIDYQTIISDTIDEGIPLDIHDTQQQTSDETDPQSEVVTIIQSTNARNVQRLTIEDDLFSSGSQSSSMPEQEVSIWIDEKEDQHAKRNILNNAIASLTDGRVSPVQSTLNTEWDDISSTQQKYYIRKAKEIMVGTLSVISPGQENLLWRSLRQEPLNADENDLKRFDIQSELFQALVQAHNEAQTWQSKRQILSIFANDFSRSELQRLIPGLTKWQIDQARDHATKSGKGQPMPEQQIFRTRLDPIKVDHFLDFISRPEFLQDVAFGTKTMKMDSGKRITIPAVVRTMIPTRIIEQYVSYCKQQNFEPAGERSLFRILDACSASMQTSLQGLDNITAEGTDAIDTLFNIVDTLVEYGADPEWAKSIKSNVKEGKRYLKMDYKSHVGRNENCADHCCTYALSDSSKKEFHSKCLHQHDIECDRCQSLELVLQEIESTISSLSSMEEQQKSSVEFDFKQCRVAIHAWKAHLLRTILQEEAKQDAMSQLNTDTCLVIVDWAMKFLPLKYRETMKDFFGKRGLSWHISAVITKVEDKYEVECFVHIFNNCTQNNYAVAAILDHLFQTIKSEFPTISKAYLRSDNAGCYHNAPLIVYLASIGNRTGVTAIRYDYSDPQAGKDICDRKTAPMKAHIRRYVNEKHDVVTAEDMKDAIESHGGLTGCRVAVVEVDGSKDLDETHIKIPGISLLYNFKYEETGVRMWKAYEIGDGSLLSLAQFQDRQQKINALKVIQPFALRQKQPGLIRGSGAGNEADKIFGCNESSCILTFKTEREAQEHMDTGKHVKEMESMSVYDSIRKKWADKVIGVSNQPAIRAAEQPPGRQTQQVPRQMGWALKITKERKRFEEKVKQFLIEKYVKGERTGNKPDPSTVAKEMKTKRDDNDKLYFEPAEWKTSQQIKSFFSRYNAKMRQSRMGEELLSEEDMEALESELWRHDLRDEVDTMYQIQHPIQAEEINICHYVQEGKLTSLKVSQLKSLCEALGLQIEGSQARKKPFIQALEELVKTCSCKQ